MLQVQIESPATPITVGASAAPKFSLIMATCGRAVELDRFFQSIARSPFRDFECIIADQNHDDRLASLIARWNDEIPIKHLRCSRGLSHARNVGLLNARGEILAFPDDDCWYAPGLLAKIADFFAANPGYALLSVGVRDEAGEISGNRWMSDACDLATANLFRTSVGYALFVRRKSLDGLPQFDESLGVGAGTPFASGEDTDYVFRLLAKGLKGRFDRSLTIHHPRGDMFSGRPTPERAFSYGCGMGRVIRKRDKFPLLPAFVAIDFIRAAYGLCCGKPGAAALCSAHGRGICAGYIAPK